MMRTSMFGLLITTLLALGCSAGPSRSTTAPLATKPSPLERIYTEGETARYLMTGSHATPQHTITYTAEAEAIVKRDEHDRFIEEIRWTKINMMGQDMPLDEFSANFRQRLSLDGRIEPAPPAPEDIARINPMLIGPCST